MNSLLQTTERRARYMMGLTTVCMVGVLMAFNAGWISRSVSYSLQSWYLVNISDAYRITTEFSDENSCRQHEHATESCRSGAAMMAQALQEQPVVRTN